MKAATLLASLKAAVPEPGASALSVHPVTDEDGDDSHWRVVFDEPVEGMLLALPPGADGTARDAVVQSLESEVGVLKAHLQDTPDRATISSEELKASNEELQL